MANWKFFGGPLYQYKSTTTGKFVSAETVREWGNISMDSNAAETRPLAADLVADRINLPAWEAEMRARIKAEYTRQYFLGIGGREQMTPQSHGQLNGLLGAQYRYLSNFSSEIAAGNLSEAQIAMRAPMYILSARRAYERANARARGIPVDGLPAYPTEDCLGLTNCKCSWTYQKRGNTWLATWQLGVADHCEVCVSHAAEWNPFVVEATE